MRKFRNKYYLYYRLKFWVVQARYNLGLILWGFLAEILWHYPAYRQAYYAYREECWNIENAALSFDLWLSSGNLLLKNKGAN